MNHGAVEDDDEATVTSDSPPRHRSQKGSGDITNLNARYRTNVSYGDEYSSLRFADSGDGSMAQSKLSL